MTRNKFKKEFKKVVYFFCQHLSKIEANKIKTIKYIFLQKLSEIPQNKKDLHKIKKYFIKIMNKIKPYEPFHQKIEKLTLKMS
jgi:hypothetical protein